MKKNTYNLLESVFKKKPDVCFGSHPESKKYAIILIFNDITDIGEIPGMEIE